MRELRLVLLGLAAVIAVVLGAGFLRRAIAPRPAADVARDVTRDVTTGAPPQRDASERPDAPATVAAGDASGPRGAIERAIAEAPDYRAFFDKLRTAFPRDYEAILANEAAAMRVPSSKADMAKDGAAKDGAAKLGAVDVDAVAADAVTALRRAHGALATKAPEAALGAIFAQQLREMEALGRRDPRLCVAFLYGSSGSGFLAFAAANRALIADAATAGLDAMIAGGTAPATRAAPTDADFQALEAALTAEGLSRAEIDALLDGKAADPPIPDARMCQAGQTYLRTLAQMPAEARGRLYGLAVDLMARS